LRQRQSVDQMTFFGRLATILDSTRHTAVTMADPGAINT
jgi:hypothetical protein